MKKIISALIICAMLCATLLAIVPASAANATREELKEKIDFVGTLVEADYTAATWKDLQGVLETAKKAYDNASTGAYMINLNYNSLVQSIEALKVNTSELDALIEKAAALETADASIKKLGYEQGDFTAESWAEFKPAIDKAKADKASNDVATVKAAVVELQAALDKVVFNPIPAEITTKLTTLLELADILIPTDYSDSAWGMVEIKVEQAKKASEDMRISVHNTAATQLETALKNLTEEKVLPTPPVLDYSYIDKIINYIDDNFTEDMFTAETWAALKAAYDEAKQVRETTKKQAELKAAYDKLNAARKNLVEAPKSQATGAPTTSTEAPQATSDDVVDDLVGCGGFVATSVAVVAIVSVLGTAVVLKKKD
jgi:hypothetical protein